MNRTAPVVLAAAWLAAFAPAQSPIGQQPEELGRVAWEREFEKARAASKRSGKPILLLFQEVPG